MKLTISKVNEVLYDARADAVNCPGKAGRLTILPHHMPLITALSAGEISVRDTQGTHVFSVENGGVLEVSNNAVVILL